MVRCALFLLLLCSSRLSSTAETEHESEPVVTSEEPGACMFTEETLIDAINASTFGRLTEAVVNCFAYRDGNGSLENAIVSGMNETANGVRYVVECVNNVLLLTESAEPFTNLTAHCAQCQDNTEDLCVPGTCSDPRRMQHEIRGRLTPYLLPVCDVFDGGLCASGCLVEIHSR